MQEINFFNEIKFENKNKLSEEDLKVFKKEFKNSKVKKYSKEKINNLIDEINEFTLRNNFIFKCYFDQLIVIIIK